MRAGIAVRATDHRHRSILRERGSDRVGPSFSFIPADPLLKALPHGGVGKGIGSERRHQNSLGIGENERAAAAAELLGADPQEVLPLCEQRRGMCPALAFAPAPLVDGIPVSRSKSLDASPPRDYRVIARARSSVCELMPELVSRIPSVSICMA